MQFELKQNENEPIFRAIARAIEQRIIRGVLRPGDRLPAEMGLAEQLGVNRSSVREAIRLLEQNGLVAREPGKRKLRVTIPSSGDLSKVVSAAMVLRKVTFHNLWETMYALEPTAAAAAAARRDEGALRALEANLKKTELAMGDSESLTSLDVEFHDLIAVAAQNGALELARQPLSQVFYPVFYRVISSLSAGPRLLFAHRMVYEAVREKDAAKAALWMQKHMRDFERGYDLAKLDMGQPIEMPA